MMSTKTVEILLATYNSEKYLEELLSSLISQTYHDFKIIVSDDCSTDGTVEILRQFAASDNRIIIENTSTKFGSACANFIHLLSISTADYVLLCDHDDVWRRDKIERCVQEISRAESSCGKEIPLLFFSDVAVVDRDLNLIAESHCSFAKMPTSESSLDLNHVIVQNPVLGCSSIANRALVCLINRRIPDPEKLIMHDWFMAIMAAADGQISYIPESLVMYRQTGENQVGARQAGKINRAIIVRAITQFQESLLQAAYIAKEYSEVLPKAAIETLCEYANLASRSRIMRIVLCFKRGYLKHSLERILGEIVALLLIPSGSK